METVSGFLQQPLIPFFVAMICFTGLLLVGTVAALVYVRRRKAQQSAPHLMPNMGGDLPDLDSLVDTSTFAPPTPTPAAAPIRSAPKGTYSLSLTDGGKIEAVEVLAILRDVEDGKLVVQIGDKVYRNFNADAALKDRVTKVMRELAQAITAKPGMPETAPVPPAPSVPNREVPTDSPTGGTLRSELLPEASETEEPEMSMPPKSVSTPPPPLSPRGEMPGDLPKFTLDEPLKPLKRGQKHEVKPVPEINIAAAIEAYLQHKLRHTPEYSEHSIHIYPSPDGGVSIEVDGQFFDSVGEVTDTQVREFLADTIQEWQDRH